MQLRTGDDRHYHMAVGSTFARGNWLPKCLHTFVLTQINQAHLSETVYVEVMVSDSRMRDMFLVIGAALLREVSKWGYSREEWA